MGQIVGSAIISHHPGLMQCEDFRRMMGAGEDSDLIAGYARMRQKIEAAKPDVVLIFDSHWFTTGYHLLDGNARYTGTYVSDEMPWYLHGIPYDYRGHPQFALDIEAVSREMGGYNRAVSPTHMERQYASLNVVKQLRLELSDIPVISASTCQNCRWTHFLESGAVIGEAIRRSDLRVLLLASGALSHKFVDIDWKPNHPRIFHESNVSSPENVASDKKAIDFMKEGRHDQIIDRWESEFKKTNWEGFGGHYLQMLGAMGGADCRAEGEPLSEYENARGTGNIHVWFDN